MPYPLLLSVSYLSMLSSSSHVLRKLPLSFFFSLWAFLNSFFGRYKKKKGPFWFSKTFPDERVAWNIPTKSAGARFQVLGICESVFWSLFACLKGVHTTSATPFLVGSVGRCKKGLFFSSYYNKAKGIIKAYICNMDDMGFQHGFNQLSNSSRGKAPEDDHEDFIEEDVWAVNLMEEREGGANWKAKRTLEYYSSAQACRRIPAIPKVIPRVNSVGHQLQSMITHRQSSAPLTIPTWSDNNNSNSNIYTNKKHNDGTAWSPGSNGNGYYTAVNENVKDDDDDEDSDEMLPPHEFIARRLARNPVVSCSMCEGIGRTLKGRDLSKLRNAILTKTGFLE